MQGDGSLYPMTPVMRPMLPSPASVLPWLNSIEQSGTYSNVGPLVTLLESRYAEFLGVSPSHVVSVANCTLGLEGAVSISHAKAWLVPDFTFTASGLAVLQSGKRLLLGDIDENTWALRSDAADTLDDRVGVMPVMPFGAPVEYDAWLGREHVIIDAAASLGTQPDLSDLPTTWSVAFSLHATKVLPAGEGGLMVFGDPNHAKTFRAWTNFGFSGERVSSRASTNAKMSEIHAAYALASLEDWANERQDWLDAQDHALRASAAIGLDHTALARAGAHPYWITDCGTGERRDAVEAALARAGIGSRRWWPRALHDMPAFADCALVGTGGTAAAMSERLLGLPMFRGLTPSQAEDAATLLASTR